jgi:hypothetical protein
MMFLLLLNLGKNLPVLWLHTKTRVAHDVHKPFTQVVPSQTTFEQATKNLHQTLCLSEITLLLGPGFSPP